MLLEGLHLPLTTPFHADGRLNLPKLEHNADRYSKTPAAGLAVLSAFGEPTLLSDEESRQVLRIAIGAAGTRMVMVAGVSRDSVTGTLHLGEFAAKLGYDAALVRRPSILSAKGKHLERTRELLTYFQAVADRSALPIVLLSEAGETLSPEIVIELASHPQIIGISSNEPGPGWMEKIVTETASVKREVIVTAVFQAVTARMQAGANASNDGLIAAGTLAEGATVLTVPSPRKTVKTRMKMVGFQVLVGSTSGMLEGLMCGAVGAMPGFAASAPQACYEVLAAWKDGDAGLALEKQERLHEAGDRVEGKLGVAGIKFGCDLNGYFGGAPRSPLSPLTGHERSEVERLMHGMRN